MYILRIEHSVPTFEGWKAAFDSDPVGRERSGVRRYRILRDADDPSYVLIDLELDTREGAEGLLANLHKLWESVEGKVMRDPKARIVEQVESKQL